jgi:hypothetical protein
MKGDLHEAQRVAIFIETENRMGVARVWRRERMESLCLMDVDFKFRKMKEL